MEAQQGIAGRGVQGLCAICGGRYARAGDAGVGGGRHLRHGWPLSAAGLAVHTPLRQENCRLATGNHHQGTTFQGGIWPPPPSPLASSPQTFLSWLQSYSTKSIYALLLSASG